jgi:hypothetical protein
MGAMMIRILMATAAAAFAMPGSWHYEATHDALGQTVHVAEIVPNAARPYVAMRVMCGGLAGISLQVNLGQMQFASMAAAPAGGLTFEIAKSPAYSAAAAMAPLTDGVGTYEIKGSEAGDVAHLLMRGDAVTVRQGRVSATFPLAGAAGAIGELIANCPLKL